MPTRGSTLETGVIYCEDNMSRLAHMPSESVDLIYLDPPFFSNRVYEVIWGDEAEMRSFEDRWEGGMQHYLGWMRERVMEMHRVLKAGGSLYLHCDPHASHYLKVMLDGVFGAERFLNEVTWKRTFSHGNVGRNFGNVTDSILVYTRGDRYTWNQQFTPYTQSYIDTFFTHTEPDGRRFRRVTLRNPAPRPNLRFPYTASNGLTYQPHPNGWSCNEARLRELDAAGRLFFPAKGADAALMSKQYLDDKPGVKVQNLWDDIPPIRSNAAERLGYPTQKPETLLERIIRTSSNPGDVVLDPFCGCGTTVNVAERLDRHWVGIDISPTAVNLMRRRLLKSTNGRCQPQVQGLPATVDQLHELKPFEFQNWVIAKVWGTAAPRKSGDMGIDGYSFMVHDPIQVKQSEKVGRNVVDNFETAMRRAGKKTGYIIAFSFTRNAREEVARTRVQDGLDISLVTVQSLLESRDEEHGPLIPAGATIAQLPLTPPRMGKELPTPEELIASDRGAQTA